MPIHLLALHGFTGSGADWELPIAALSARRTDVRWSTPDLPGHGGYLPAPPAYTVAAMAASVAAALQQLPRPRVLVGYSMGGRVALHAAVHWPERVDAVVLIGAHPGLTDPGERRARAAEDAARAARVRALGATKFCAAWARVPIIATQDRIPEPWRSALRDRRTRCSTEGLARAAEIGGTGSMDPAWDRLGRLPSALVVAGADDPKYRTLAAEISEAAPAATLACIPGAGHAAHLEAPDAFAERLDRYLSSVSPTLSR